MLNEIISDAVLHSLIRQTCDENEVFIDIDNSLLSGGCLSDDNIIIIKLDAYYNSKQMHNPPPSPNCLIVLRCKDGTYNVYIIELRHCNGAKRVKLKDIRQKFETAIFDFVGSKYSHIFSHHKYKIKSVFLWLVADPFCTSGLSKDVFEKKVKGTVYDTYLSMRPLPVLGRLELILPKFPNQSDPYPKISPC